MGPQSGSSSTRTRFRQFSEKSVQKALTCLSTECPFTRNCIRLNRTHVAVVAAATLFGVLGCEPSLVAQSRPRVVHVFVALADNRTQGIVPVAATLGNGEDPARNLYWGSAYGVKTFFARSADWQLLKTEKGSKSEVLERCVFKHRREDVYLIADAYRGSLMKQAIVDFLQAAAGGVTHTIGGEKDVPRISVTPDLVTYIGHQGFMDFQLPSFPQKLDKT